MKTGAASQKQLSVSAVDFPRINESYTGRYIFNVGSEAAQNFDVGYVNACSHAQTAFIISYNKSCTYYFYPLFTSAYFLILLRKQVTSVHRVPC